MDFTDEDIRPFTGSARPMTGMTGDTNTPPLDDPEERPVTGFRPLTGMRPMTGSEGSGRAAPGSARPKTGYRQASARVGTARQQQQPPQARCLT